MWQFINILRTVGIERQVQEAQRDGEEEVGMGVSVHLR